MPRAYPWNGTPTRNLKIHEPIYTALFQLKAIQEGLAGREMTWDEVLANMASFYQEQFKDMKISVTDVKKWKR